MRGHCRGIQRWEVAAYRGVVAIHAGRGREWDHLVPWWRARVGLPTELAYGAIVGVAELLGVVVDRGQYIEAHGLDWQWLLRLRPRPPAVWLWGQVARLTTPRAWRGQPGLWGLPDDELAEDVLDTPAGHLVTVADWCAALRA